MDSGFAIYPTVLPHEVSAQLAAALESRRQHQGRAGTRHLMGDPDVAAIAADPRIVNLAADVLGGSAVPYRATLFEKTEQANWLIAWHQDTALPLDERFECDGWGPWSQKLGVTYAHAPAWALKRVVALRLHLDDSDADNGPLRVLPGSHAQGVLTDATVHELVSRSEEEVCLVPRGGVIAMRPLLIHCSSKLTSERPRRVLHIEYSSSLDLGPGMRLAVV